MIPRERTARTNGTIAHGSRFARQKRLEGQTARGRRHQPQSEAVISGHGRVYRERRTDLAFSEDPNLRTPRLAELANSCSLDGHVLDGPKRRAMGRERTWPNHARHPPRQDLAWAISAGLRGLDRTDKGAAARARPQDEGRARRRRRCAKAALRESGGVARAPVYWSKIFCSTPPPRRFRRARLSRARWGLRKAMRAAPTLAGRPRARLRTALLGSPYLAC